MTFPNARLLLRRAAHPALRLGLIGAIACTGLAQAQTAAPAADPMIAVPAVQSSPGGYSYLSGGAGSEERQAMEAQRRQFPLKVVISAGKGEYVTADKLSLVTAQGEVLAVRDAGPVVMIQAPAGAYTLVVTYQGRTERRAVPRAEAPQTLNLRFPG